MENEKEMIGITRKRLRITTFLIVLLLLGGWFHLADPLYDEQYHKRFCAACAPMSTEGGITINCHDDYYYEGPGTVTCGWLFVDPPELQSAYKAILAADIEYQSRKTAERNARIRKQLQITVIFTMLIFMVILTGTLLSRRLNLASKEL